MTNKTKPRKGRKGLKLLDLSFDCESQADPKCTPSPGIRVKSAWTRSAPIGYKSHGSQRAMKLHPPSPYSFNKSAEYQNQIQADLEQLITAESLMHVSSPTWAIAVSHESNHSGESPLFVHRLLSPGKYDTKPNYRSTAHNKYGRQRPLSANDAGRYHPNSTHQYLTKTGLNVSQSEIDLRLGKPTRTTLLRARQRVNSAPQNAYDIHREYVKRVDKLAESRRTLMPSYSLQDLLEIPLEDESLHSFLTGARYNRAHYLDAKSLITHGVYMPRSNPGGCFIVPRNKYSEQTGEAATDSAHDYDHGSAYRSHVESSLRSASSPIPPPQRPSSPQPTTASDEENGAEPSESPANQAEGGGVREGETAESGRLNVNGESIVSKETKERKNCLAAMRSVMSADDALSIKGKGLDNMRPGYHHVSAVSSSVTHIETPPAILAVSISGMSLTRSLTFASGSDRSVLVGQPLITPVPRVSSTRGQRQEERKVRSAPVIAEKTPVQMEDKCFNVPSISSEENDDFEHGRNGKMEEANSSLGKERKSHVRFADQVDVASSGEVAESKDQVGMSSEPIDKSEIDLNDAKDQISSSANDVIVSAADSTVGPEQLDLSKNQMETSVDQFITSEAQMIIPSEPVGILSEKKETPTVSDHDVSSANKERKADDNVVFFMTEEEQAAASEPAKNASTQRHEDESQKDATLNDSHPNGIASHDAPEQSLGHSNDEVECQHVEGNNLGSSLTLNTSDILSQDEGDVMPNGVISVEISKCERAATSDGEPITVADPGSDVTDLLTNQSTEREEGTLPASEVEGEEFPEPIICVDISTKPAREQQD